MHRFAKWFALIKVLERMLCTYNQTLILHMNYGVFSSPPLWGGREGLFFEVVRDFIFICKTLIINSLKEIFALRPYFDVALTIVQSIEKSGSDRKCINMQFNNSPSETLIALTEICIKRKGKTKKRGATP